jgi:hypothetical protein
MIIHLWDGEIFTASEEEILHPFRGGKDRLDPLSDP